MTYTNKDFIRTTDGLYFAIVTSEMELGKILCNLRYITENSGKLRKLNTQSANQFLTEHHPEYLFYSKKLQTHLHAVAIDDVAQHYSPYERISWLLQASDSDRDAMETLGVEFLRLLAAQGIDCNDLGIVGSLLIQAHGPDSDIDLIVRTHQTFEKIRQAIQQLMRTGHISGLGQQDWEESYARRDCTLNLSDYMWHEQRKFNKFMFRDIKFDLTCIEESSHHTRFPVQKLPAVTIEAPLISDEDVFRFPARYPIEHDEYEEVLCYTATYIGQVFKGETLVAQGPVEVDQAGIKRLIIGTTREAKDEYIRTRHPSVTTS